MNRQRIPVTAAAIEADLAQIAAAMRADPPAEDLAELVDRRRAELGIPTPDPHWENRTEADVR